VIGSQHDFRPSFNISPLIARKSRLWDPGSLKLSHGSRQVKSAILEQGRIHGWRWLHNGNF
jgi:hypothetical protein